MFLANFHYLKTKRSEKQVPRKQFDNVEEIETEEVRIKYERRKENVVEYALETVHSRRQLSL